MLIYGPIFKVNIMLMPICCYENSIIALLMYCIVLLYCIMRPYTEGRIDRYHRHIVIPKENPKSTLNLG